MKKLTLTLLSLLVVGAIYFTSCKKTNEELVKDNATMTSNPVGSVEVGSRNALGNPVLSLTQVYFESTIDSILGLSDYQLTSISNFELDDDPNIFDYNMNLSFNITFQDSNNVPYSASYYFHLIYDNNTNKYLLDSDLNDEENNVINGGKVSCLGINCKGCTAAKGSRGEPGYCIPCISRVDEAIMEGPDCKSTPVSGNGPAWLDSVGTILIGILGLLN